jgi:hypothetical protein
MHISAKALYLTLDIIYVHFFFLCVRVRVRACVCVCVCGVMHYCQELVSCSTPGHWCFCSKVILFIVLILFLMPDLAIRVMQEAYIVNDKMCLSES